MQYFLTSNKHFTGGLEETHGDPEENWYGLGEEALE